VERIPIVNDDVALGETLNAANRAGGCLEVTAAWK